MIIITGAAGFIGSNLAKKLNSMGYTDLLLVDDIKNLHKKQNIDNIIFNLEMNSNYYKLINQYLY